jgi:hypothetical protein
MPEPAPPGHQRCRVMAGRLRVMLPQRGEPVLGAAAAIVTVVRHDKMRQSLLPR